MRVFGAHWTAMPMPPTSITAVVGLSAATGPLTKAIIGGPSGRGLLRCAGRAGRGQPLRPPRAPAGGG